MKRASAAQRGEELWGNFRQRELDPELVPPRECELGGRCLDFALPGAFPFAVRYIRELPNREARAAALALVPVQDRRWVELEVRRYFLVKQLHPNRKA